MLRISELTLPLSHTEDELNAAILDRLGIPAEELRQAAANGDARAQFHALGVERVAGGNPGTAEEADSQADFLEGLSRRAHLCNNRGDLLFGRNAFCLIVRHEKNLVAR